MFGFISNRSMGDHGKALITVIGIAVVLYLILPAPAMEQLGWTAMPSMDPLRVEMVIG